MCCVGGEKCECVYEGVCVVSVRVGVGVSMEEINFNVLISQFLKTREENLITVKYSS